MTGNWNRSKNKKPPVSWWFFEALGYGLTFNRGRAEALTSATYSMAKGEERVNCHGFPYPGRNLVHLPCF